MIPITEIKQAKERIAQVVEKTPLTKDLVLSERYKANIYLKREDLQLVRSYKIRGAYNKIASLSDDDRKRGVVCASAGNHAQGVAFACNHLNIKGRIYMPSTTPKQKINQVNMFGKDNVEVVLIGDTYDQAYYAAISDCEERKSVFIHPFDDPVVAAGQGTIAMEIEEQLEQLHKKSLDYIFVPIGGGGLVSGVGSYLKQNGCRAKIIGVEPEGAPALVNSFKENKRVTLEEFEKFVDGASVATIGKINFDIAKEVIDEMKLVPEGKVCTTILQMYNESAIVVEPAGAMSVAALDFYADEIKGKNIVCIISGGNNDITRTEEIKERSMLYEELKHYFIIQFPQRAGALREFLNDILGPEDDITHFEYTRKNSRENGPALVGIETKSKQDYIELVKRLKEHNINFLHVNDSPDLFHLLI